MIFKGKRNKFFGLLGIFYVIIGIILILINIPTGLGFNFPNIFLFGTLSSFVTVGGGIVLIYLSSEKFLQSNIKN